MHQRPVVRLVWCLFGAACGIGLSLAVAGPPVTPFLLASLGGTAVFLFGLTRAPAAQPRALLGATSGVRSSALLATKRLARHRGSTYWRWRFRWHSCCSRARCIHRLVPTLSSWSRCTRAGRCCGNRCCSASVPCYSSRWSGAACIRGSAAILCRQWSHRHRVSRGAAGVAEAMLAAQLGR